MKWYQNPKILCFAGGVAAALVGAKVAKSPKTRELCVAGMAKGMKLQQDARVTLQNTNKKWLGNSRKHAIFSFRL